MVKVKFTKHAEDMLIERKFTKEDIVSVIENPDWKENDEHENGIWHIFKKIGEKVLRIVIKGRQYLRKKYPYKIAPPNPHIEI